MIQHINNLTLEGKHQKPILLDIAFEKNNEAKTHCYFLPWIQRF